MKCTPKTKNGRRRNIGKNIPCNKECEYWWECLIELGLPNDFNVQEKDTRLKAHKLGILTRF